MARIIPGNESAILFKHLQNGISRERLKRINAILKDDHLDKLATSDIYWDEIVELNPLGEEDVYDATVEGVHNFVANDIIVHNSIEQDADIVAFIYRPEYYDILEDEEGQSLKGIAEIIVVKHRHGAENHQAAIHRRICPLLRPGRPGFWRPA